MILSEEQIAEFERGREATSQDVYNLIDTIRHWREQKEKPRTVTLKQCHS